MASISYLQASDFLNYSLELANDISAEEKWGKFFLLIFEKLFPKAAMVL